MQIFCDNCKAELHPKLEMVAEGDLVYTFSAAHPAAPLIYFR